MTLYEVLADSLANLKIGRRIFCGMTANVDLVIPFQCDDFLLAQERFGSDPGAAGEPPSANLTDTIAALDYAAWFMANGMGGEADIPSIRPLLPLMDMLPHFRAVGGTGVQAANWLAGSGFSETVVHVPFHAPEFNGLLHPNLRIIDNNPGCADLMRNDPVFSEVHCVIDYAQNARLRYGGLIRKTDRHDRVILSGDRCNSRLRISRKFHAAVCRPHADSALLVTGFNSCRAMEDFTTFVDQCAALMDGYHAVNPGGFIHAEDCFQWDRARERRLALTDKVWPRTDSLGMNEVEYRELCELFGLDGRDVYGALTELTRRHGFRRVCLHTSVNCRTVTRYRYADELRATGLAILFSGARAFYGDFVELDKIAELVETTRSISENARIPEPVRLEGGFLGIEMPTLKGMPIKSAIGLGDAFTAGLLAYL